jgi:hypothetical protein
MKTIPLSFAISLLIFFSCGKNHPEQPSEPSLPPDLGKPYALPSGSEANAAYDNNNYGIYKGITINAQIIPETFTIHLDNDGHSVYALEYSKGYLRDSLVSYAVDPNTNQARQPYAIDSTPVAAGTNFYGVFESFDLFQGDVLVDFSVKGDGSEPYTGIYLDQNSGQNAILKERAGKQVFCFEGTFVGGYPVAGVGPDTGRISLVLSADTVIATMLSFKMLNGFSPSGGSVSNNSFIINNAMGGGGIGYQVTGTVSGDSCSGTWVISPSFGLGATGQFTAKRTL